MSWPKFIGIAGGTGSGKTTVAELIQKEFGKDKCCIISMDSYYKDFPNLPLSERKKINYDHPSAFDIELFKKHLLQLKEDKCVEIPEYSFSQYRRTGKSRKVCPTPILIVEGILLFYYEDMRNIFDIKIFIDADSDVRIIRRIRRDVLKRGRGLKSVTQQYLKTVHPMHIQFVEPTKQFADIIIPRGGKNEIAMDIIIAKIKSLLNEYKKN